MRRLPASLKDRVVPQFERPISIGPVEVYLPLPPSANKLTKNNPAGKGRSHTEEYSDWIELAGIDINSQKPKAVTGPVQVWLYIEDSDRTGGDADNRLKPVLDLLVTHQIIKADDKSVVRSVHALWSAETRGCRVSIRPAPVHGEVG